MGSMLARLRVLFVRRGANLKDGRRIVAGGADLKAVGNALAEAFKLSLNFGRLCALAITASDNPSGVAL
jgi:hypothetical protein